MRWRIVIFLLLLGVLYARLDCADAENISKSPYPSEDVSIAFNETGEIGAVWVEKFSDGNQQVYFSIRRNGLWSSPEIIRDQSGISANPRIDKGVNGGFVAVWHDKTINCIRFAQYQGSWSTPVTVSQVGGYDLGWPAVTTTTNGRIAVAWMRGNPTNSDTYVSIFQNGWSGPVNVSNTPFSSKYCDLASGPNGEIYVVWQDDRWQPDNVNDILRPMINNDQGNGTWMQSSEINDIQGWCFRPVVAINSRNDILTCFYYHQWSSYNASYRRNGVWESPQVISDVGNHQDHDRYFSDICPYEDGFLYVYRDSAFNIFYIGVLEGKPAKAIALTSSYQCYHPSIDYSPSLGAVAAWTDRSGNCDVFVALFDPQDTLPPGAVIQPPLSVEANYLNIPLAATELKTDLIINRNLFTIQYFRKITWAFDTRWIDWNITLSKFRIYRKLKTADSWDLLAEVSPSVLLHIDKNGVLKEDLFDYQVRGVDNLGNEFYAYNLIRWAPNPANSDGKITVQDYNVYRKLSGQPSSSFTLWKTVDAATNLLEDHSTEIRQQIEYDYALTAVSDKGKESVKAEALKITGSALKSRKL